MNILYVFLVWCLLDADTSAAYGLRERVFERFCGCSFDRLQGMGIQVTGDTDGRMPKVRGYSLDASPFGNQQSSIRVSYRMYGNRRQICLMDKRMKAVC